MLCYLAQIRLGKFRLGQVRLCYVRLGQVRLGQVRLGQITRANSCLDLWWSKQHCDHFFSRYIVFSSLTLIPPILHNRSFLQIVQQVRLGQVRLGQVRLGQVRLGQVRLGSVDAVAQFEAPRYKPEGRGIRFPVLSLEFFIDIILPAAL